MAAFEDLSFVFDEDRYPGFPFFRMAAHVSWEEWETDSVAYLKVAKLPEMVVSNLLTLANERGTDLGRVLRNAVATASEDQLRLARLATVVLLRDGVLTEVDVRWLSLLPTPTPFDLFMSERLSGNFNPQPQVFAYLASVFAEDASRATALRNLLRSLAPITGSSKQLFDRLVQSGLPASTDTKLLFSAITRRAQTEPLAPDMDTQALDSLPQEWRSAILADNEYSRLFLVPETIAAISSDPTAFSDTPERIKSHKLQARLTEEFTSGDLSVNLIASLLKDRIVCEAIERDFDWSVLQNLSKTINIVLGTDVVPKLNEFRYQTKSGRLFSNLAVIAFSGKPEIFLPKELANIAVARQLIGQADRDILRFAITTSSGKAQFFIMQSILSIQDDVDLQRFGVDTFLSTMRGENTLPRTLNAVLPSASAEQIEQAYRFAFRHADHCAAFLAWHGSFRAWFIKRISSGEVPDYTNSLELLLAYNSLGDDGALIVQALLSQRNGNQEAHRALLVKILQNTPNLIPHIFRSKNIRLDDFVGVILNPSFRENSQDQQSAILGLRSRRGKSALQLAFESGKLTNDFLEWISQQGALTKKVVHLAPELLAQEAKRLPDLLVGLTRRPSRAKKLVEGIDRSILLEALPDALSLMRNEPRVAAALELAVRSDVAALSHFMRLAKSLAPPYEKSDFGRRFDRLYSVYEIPKRSGGARTISAPAAHLKAAQRALLNLLYNEVVSDQAMGFVPGRSIRDNAAKHIGQQIVVNVDVKAFFPSTSYKRVYAIGRKLCGGQLSPLSIRLFAEICCHDGNLATGAPTSPTVSNLILRELDGRLDRIAGRLSVNYSRYADDLTFSGGDAAIWMLKPATTFLARLGYELDPKKTNIFRKGRRQIVTGAVVNEKVNLARTLRRAIRAAVDYRARGKQPFLQDRPLSDAMLNGYLSYLRMLSAETAAPLLQKLKGAAGWRY